MLRTSSQNKPNRQNQPPPAALSCSNTTYPSILPTRNLQLVLSNTMRPSANQGKGRHSHEEGAVQHPRPIWIVLLAVVFLVHWCLTLACAHERKMKERSAYQDAATLTGPADDPENETTTKTTRKTHPPPLSRTKASILKFQHQHHQQQQPLLRSVHRRPLPTRRDRSITHPSGQT